MSATLPSRVNPASTARQFLTPDGQIPHRNATTA